MVRHVATFFTLSIFTFTGLNVSAQARPPAAADLTLSVAASPNPVLGGGIVTLTATIQNVGSAEADNVNLTHYPPFDFRFSSCTSSVGSCSATGGPSPFPPGSGTSVSEGGFSQQPGPPPLSVTASLGTIAAGASVVVLIKLNASFPNTETVENNVTTLHRSSSTIDKSVATKITVDPAGVADQQGGPPGTMVSLLLEAPGNKALYAGTADGVFKSVDGGTNWISANSGFGESFVDALAIAPSSPNVLYGASFFSPIGSLFKSTDGANSWTETGTVPGDVSAIAIDPGHSETVYVGTAGSFSDDCSQFMGGVYKSIDGGASWISVSSGLPHHDIQMLAIDPVDPSTIYAATQGIIGLCGNTTAGNIFKSTNAGVTWEMLSYSFPDVVVDALTFDPSDSTIMYAGTSDGISYAASVRDATPHDGQASLFKSTDRGSTWTKLQLPGASGTTIPAGIISLGSVLDVFSFDGSVSSVAIDPQRPYIVYVVQGGQVLKSTTAGGNWVLLNSGLRAVAQTLIIDPANTSQLYAGTWNGVFKSSNGAVNWMWSTAGLGTVPVNVVAIDPVNPSKVYAGSDFSGLFKSGDAGVSWDLDNSAIPFGAFIESVVADPNISGTVYISSGFGLFKSTNGGASWFELSVGGDSLAIDPIHSNTLYAGTVSGVFKSIDGGITWNLKNSGFPPSVGQPYYGANSVLCLAVDPLTPTTLYAGLGGTVFKSVDGGATWSASSVVIPSSGSAASTFSPFPILITLAIDPSSPSTLYATDSFAGTYKSTDGGSTWHSINAGWSDTNTSALVIDPANSQILYRGTSNGVFKSTDGGASWFNTGISNALVESLAIDPNTSAIIYAGTYNYGVLKTTDAGNTWQATGSK
jgi:photosystem II stability/assembly factor-like uncharacterized protein